jgi:RND superfamily putative drug exporter
VAFGVLLDTIVVRSVLVTALNLDLGPRVWWPSRLARQPQATAETAPVRKTAESPVARPAVRGGPWLRG